MSSELNKGKTSPIRRYMTKSVTSPAIMKPLSSTNDNIIPATKCALTKGSPTKGSPNKLPIKDSPTKVSPTKGSPTKGSPTKSTPTKGLPMKSATLKKEAAMLQKPRNLIDLLEAAKKPSFPNSSSIANEFRPPTMKRSLSAASSLDTCLESWLNGPVKSRKKLIAKTESYDRLTPKIDDMPSAQFIIKKSTQQDTTLIDSNDGSESYQVQVAKACGIEPGKRILSFTPTIPASKNVDISKNAAMTKLMTRTTSLQKRYILSSPEKVLDAPYMDNDYYLNLLDWSSENVVAIGLGKAVYLWRADSGAMQQLNHDSEDQVTSLSWSDDGVYLAVGTGGGDTQLYDVVENTRLRTMSGQDDRICALSWNKHVVSSGGKGSIYDHDVRMAKHTVRELRGHTEAVCGLKWRHDGQLLASGGADHLVNIWDARSTTSKFTLRQHSSAVKALAWCPWKNNTLATGGGRDDKKIHFWNTVTGGRVSTINAGSQVTSLNWSKHYHQITSTHGSPHNQVTVWEYPSLDKVIDIPAHDTRILHSVLSPDGQVLATAAADESLKFWRIFDANGRAPLTTESGRVSAKRDAEIRRSKTIR